MFIGGSSHNLGLLHLQRTIFLGCAAYWKTKGKIIQAIIFYVHMCVCEYVLEKPLYFIALYYICNAKSALTGHKIFTYGI